MPAEHPPPAGLDILLGTEYLEHGEDYARARMRITADHLQPWGIVHGAVHSALAESIASRTTGMLVGREGKIAVGMSNQTSFFRPVREGATLNAEARARHRGRTTWVWDVDITDEDGRLCASGRITLAVRDPQPE